MTVFLTADLHLNDEETARKIGLTVDEYNSIIIKKWNEVVTENDVVLVLGTIGNKKMHIIKDIITQLNGIKYLIDYENNNFVSRTIWQWAGFRSVWTIEVHYDTTINNKPAKIWIKNNLNHVEETDFLCAGEKILGNELYKDNKMNLALSQWDYYPIEMNTVIGIINDYTSNENL